MLRWQRFPLIVECVKSKDMTFFFLTIHEKKSVGRFPLRDTTPTLYTEAYI